MCYPKPRPRCSSHASKTLTAVRERYRDGTASYEAVEIAERDYSISKAGIRDTRSAASQALNDGDVTSAVRMYRSADSAETMRGVLTAAADDGAVTDEVSLHRFIAEHHPDAEYVHEYQACEPQETLEAVAEHPQTNVSLIRLYAKSNDYHVRMAVADNPSTPPEILVTLLKDLHRVRQTAAANPSLPTKHLAPLSEHEDPSTRRCVAMNPLAPVDVLTTLAQDEDPQVRHEAQSRIFAKPHLVAEWLGMEDDVPAVENLLREYPSQAKSMLGWS